MRHEGVWRSEWLYKHFLDLATSWRWVVSFTPQPLYLRGKSPSTHCVGGRLESRDGLDDVKKRRVLTLLGLELRPLGRPAVTSRYNNCGRGIKLRPSDSLKCHDVHTKFYQNLSSASSAATCRQIYTTTPIRVHFVHNAKGMHKL
jgi:hypothetical protein